MGLRSALKSIRSAGWTSLAALALWGASQLAPLALPAQPGLALPGPAPRAGSIRIKAPKAPVSAPLMTQGQAPAEESSGDGPADSSLMPAQSVTGFQPQTPPGSGGYPRPEPSSPSGGTVHGTRGRPPPELGG